MNDKLRRVGEKYFGEDYFQFLLAAGVACDIDSASLAKELDTTIATVEEMRVRYRNELLDLKTHANVLAEVYEELSRIRLTSIAMKLQEQLLNDLESGNLEPKEKNNLLQFLTKTLEAKSARDKEKRADPKSEAELDERIKRLAEGRGLRLVK